MPSKNHGRLNGCTFDPDRVAGAVMYNPHYRNMAPGVDRDAPWHHPGALAVEDSGAFQERDMLRRLTADAALDRQLAHEGLVRDRVPGFRFDAVVTYDLLVGVDEALEPRPDGTMRRVKRRGTAATAAAAVAETVRSAAAYARRRDEVAGAIAYAVQGADPDQYAQCAADVLPHVRPGRDWLALGGFCILGMRRGLMPEFRESCTRVVPMAVAAGAARIHLLGVCYHPAVEYLARLCHEHGIPCSTDSASIEVNSVMGRVWDARRMATGSPWDCRAYPPSAKVRTAESVALGTTPAGRYRPAELALANIERFTAWCRSLP